MVDVAPVVRVGVVALLAASAVAVWTLSHPRGRWGDRLRSRFLLGVPWGTLVIVAGLFAVYLYVQGAADGWHTPLAIPFTSWSYRYPLGVVVAPFAHSSAGHFTGNLVGTLLLAPVAEFAFGHFPTERGSTSFGSWRTNPYVRAFVAFPAGVAAVALAGVLFHWGPVIGFSGAVFAFAGFGIVRYPLATLIALIGRNVADTVFYAIRDPIVTAEGSSQYVTPWWTGIAVQGHFVGFLLGVLAGVLLAGRRDDRPPASHLWLATVLVTASLSMWAVWWYRGGGSYVLYRGLGVMLVFATAVLVTLSVRASRREFAWGVDRRTVGVLLLVLPVATMAFVAVPVNAWSLHDSSVPGESVEVGGYTVTYAEGVVDQRVGSVDVSLFGETTQVHTSGVIVTNPSREVWYQAVPAGRLAADGRATVRIGGLGWERTVTARRSDWSVAGNRSVYQVWLRVEDREPKHVFSSRASTAAPVVDGRNVTLAPTGETVRLVVSRDGRTLGRAPIPVGNATVAAGGLEFVRRGNTVVAVADDTRVAVVAHDTG